MVFDVDWTGRAAGKGQVLRSNGRSFHGEEWHAFGRHNYRKSARRLPFGFYSLSPALSQVSENQRCLIDLPGWASLNV